MAAEQPRWGTATHHEPIAGKVAIVGIGQTEHVRRSDKTAQQLALEAISAAAADAGISMGDIDGLMYPGTSLAGFDAAFADHVGTGGDLWVSTAGGGSVAAGTAPSVAAEALAAGAARYVVNVCSITWGTGRAESTSSPADAHRADPAKRNFEMPLGWYPQPVYFAAIARRHMHEFGTTLEQLGQYAVTCRQHALRTPSAVLHDRPLTMDDYLGAPYLVDPFRAPDCCLITDGACAFIMTTPERAADAPNPVVEVAGVGSAVADTGLQVLQQSAFTSTPQVYSAPPAFAMAGVRPSDVDVLAVYDPFTIVGLMQVEDMGFCDKGMGGPFALDGGLDVDGGALPYNTHGGMLAHAYVLAIDHVLEVVRQLRGTADAQVDGCEIGVYGGYGPGASTLVLQRGR